MRGENNNAAIMFHSPNGARAISGHDQSSVPIVRHAVGVTGWMHEGANPLAGRPLQNFVAGDIGPKQVPFARVPYRTFAKLTIAKNPFHPRILGHDPLKTSGLTIGF
jgi:hypothetical protein